MKTDTLPAQGSQLSEASSCTDSSSQPAIASLVPAAIRRLRSWRTPCHWSRAAWAREILQVSAIAESQAAHEFDPSKGVPFVAFVHQRVVGHVLAFCRREWKYGSRFAPLPAATPAQADDLSNEDDPASQQAIALSEQSGLCDDVREAVAALPESQRKLLEQLFWEGRTESELAGTLGLSQCTVNKRKRAALDALRAQL